MNSKQTQKSVPHIKNVPSAVPLFFSSWKSGAESGRGWNKDARMFMTILKLEKKIIILPEPAPPPPPPYYSGNKVQEKCQTYWTTQQVPNSVLSFKCFLASFLETHATGSSLRLWQTLSTLPPRPAADNQTRSDSHCSRGNRKVTLKSRFT